MRLDILSTYEVSPSNTYIKKSLNLMAFPFLANAPTNPSTPYLISILSFIRDVFLSHISLFLMICIRVDSVV